MERKATSSNDDCRQQQIIAVLHFKQTNSHPKCTQIFKSNQTPHWKLCGSNNKKKIITFEKNNTQLSAEREINGNNAVNYTREWRITNMQPNYQKKVERKKPPKITFNLITFLVKKKNDKISFYLKKGCAICIIHHISMFLCNLCVCFGLSLFLRFRKMSNPIFADFCIINKILFLWFISICS